MIDLDTRHIGGSLNSHKPISIEIASSSSLESLWDDLVREHHYLNYQKFLGRYLKYLAFIDQKPVAALSWSAAARKLHVRDWFIGWNDIQRRQHLHHFISNSRFLIPPWVKIYNLGSHVLSLVIKRLNQDWLHRYGVSLWMLETFVDPRYFHGTLYKASNWIPIGKTAGYGRKGIGYIHHGHKKEVYVYVLNPEFRKNIGCSHKPYRFQWRPPLNHRKLEALKMILRDTDWHPEIEASLDLNTDDVKDLADELICFHEKFHDSFNRIEQKRLGLGYLQGLLSNCDRKSVEPMALNLLHGKTDVRNLQRFMQIHNWDDNGMLETHLELLAPTIATDDGMITLDPSEFPKKGKESVGVIRQYCGRIGKVENCQSGVFIGYSGKKGYGLLNCQLYMPEKWFSEEYEERRVKTLVPDELVFQTKQQIALTLIKRIVQTGLFPAKWIGCDGAFGSDINFLRSLPTNFHYFASIASNEKIFLQKPEVGLRPYKGRGRRPTKVCVLNGQEPVIVKDLAKSSTIKWHSVILGEGAKGPIVAQAACIRVYRCRDGLPVDEPVWLFLRKNADGQIKYAVSNAPAHTTFIELCQASTMRWPIEQCFQEAKSQLGMSQYEHRSWPAWHRHMLYVFLGLHFLLHVRLKLKKNDNNNGSPSTMHNSIHFTIEVINPPRST